MKRAKKSATLVNIAGECFADVLPSRRSISVPARGQSDSRRRLHGLQRRASDTQQGRRSAV